MQHVLSIRNFILPVIALLALTACGGKKGELRIKGEIQGLNHADLVIYSRDGVFLGIDTLHVRQGLIDWSCPCNKEHGTVTIVYPTYSTLTVFGGSGDVIKIDGEAKQLNATAVYGTPENEAYTALRKQLREVPTAASRDSLTKAFISANPESPLSRFLQIENLSVQKPVALRNGESLPDFTLVTRKGDTITTDSLRGKYTMIAFWANWKGDATNVNGRIRRLRHQVGEHFQFISYNMDVNKTILEYVERTDTITWHSYADCQVFQSPLASRLGICDIPYVVLADTACRIVATGKDWGKDIAPELEIIISSLKKEAP